MITNEPSSPVCYAGENDFMQTSDDQPLRLWILGAGGVGGYIGGRLLEAGADVTFLVRDSRLAQLQQHGLTIHSPLGDTAVAAQAVTAETATAAPDLILLACKTYDLDSAIDSLQRVAGPATRILPLLNGLSHLERLDQVFGRERILGGLAHLALEQGPDGHIHHLNEFHRLVYGCRHHDQQALVERLATELTKTNLECRLAADIDQALWDKYLFLTTLAGATCLFRGSIGEILRTASGETFIRELLAECIAVAAAAGQAPPAATLAEYRDLLTDPGAAYTASMLRDIRAGRRTEADAILGDMLRRARRADLPCDRLALAYSHLQVYENSR